MSRLAQLSSFGAWSPLGVVCHIRSCSDVFSLVIASSSASFRSLVPILEFNPMSLWNWKLTLFLALFL